MGSDYYPYQNVNFPPHCKSPCSPVLFLMVAAGGSCDFMFLMVAAVSLPFYGGRGQLTVAFSLLIDGGS